MSGIAKFQIGKAGITDGVIQALNGILKDHKHVRISVLRASGRNRDNIQEMANSLVSSLGARCTYRIIGFTIVLRKHVAKEGQK